MTPEVVFIDGGGERWRVCGYQAIFTVVSEDTGAVTQVDSSRLKSLGVEWDGKTLKQVAP